MIYYRVKRCAHRIITGNLFSLYVFKVKDVLINGNKICFFFKYDKQTIVLVAIHIRNSRLCLIYTYTNKLNRRHQFYKNYHILINTICVCLYRLHVPCMIYDTLFIFSVVIMLIKYLSLKGDIFLENIKKSLFCFVYYVFFTKMLTCKLI